VNHPLRDPLAIEVRHLFEEQEVLEDDGAAIRHPEDTFLGPKYPRFQLPKSALVTFTALARVMKNRFAWLGDWYKSDTRDRTARKVPGFSVTPQGGAESPF
jgi:hypothetical protein